MYLTRKERQALRDVVARGDGSLDEVIWQIRQINPDAFHSADTLPGRRFHHQPVRGEPCVSFARSHVRRAAKDAAYGTGEQAGAAA
ncbi:hypothetical protein R75461_07218 [Paraburkholderia nemoris]|uniref:hypothetical protein n=1 Tax=Paraburkholderia nemoris TaxID=2793076 RepID=UPI001909959F|nr:MULTISPECIES: hypothetical protein [Paraburkholderia]MBK3787077.1 hypothetical protein [Paraburkholderia aspalathi]CAE6845224.1 hypothetical protein R75461_07218 [Paraburkholderia nemoris]